MNEREQMDDMNAAIAVACANLRQGYDPMAHRQLSGCTHAISETCDKCHCPTCGSPVVVMKSTHEGATSFYMPLVAVLAELRSAARGRGGMGG